MSVILEIAAVLLILAFGSGVVWLVMENQSVKHSSQQLQEAVRLDPDTRAGLSDRIGALEEQVHRLMVEMDGFSSTVASVRGSLGALRKDLNRLQEGMAVPQDYSPDDLNNLFTAQSNEQRPRQLKR